MPPVVIAAAIAAGASVAAAGAGAASAAAARNKAESAGQAALDEINKLGAGPDLAQQIILKHFQSAGVLTPEAEKSINLGVSKVSQIQDNQKNVDAQNNALQLIQQRAQGGLSPTDLANLNQIRAQAAQDTQAKTQAILQNYAQRGMGGSGAALAAQLSAAQGGAQQESQQGLQVGSIAAQNALGALGQQGQLASQLRGQDFSENQAREQAADAFKQFDVSNQIAQQARNVSSANQAQAANLQNAQNISNANTSQQNAELQRELQAQQQMYQNQEGVAQMKANALNNQQVQQTQAANNIQQGWQNIGAAVGQGAGAIAGAYGGISGASSNGYSYPQLQKMFQKNNDNSSGVIYDANGNASYGPNEGF